jgi:hypothetical protein
MRRGKHTHKQAYKILFGKHEGKRTVRRDKNNEEMGLKEPECEDRGWINPDQDTLYRILPLRS